VAIQNDDKILIGGLFTAFNGVGRNRIARLNNCEGTTFSSINVNSCNAYTAPNNQVFNNSGIYVITIPNAEGCDSLITLNLNISQPAPVVLTQTACNSYIAPNGTTLTASGLYNYAFLNNVETTIKNSEIAKVSQKIMETKPLKYAEYFGLYLDEISETKTTVNDAKQELKNQFIKEYCDGNTLKHKNTNIKPDMMQHIFPQVSFISNQCNPCDKTCEFSIIESKLITEEKMKPISTLP
jgi:hypothetical protein